MSVENHTPSGILKARIGSWLAVVAMSLICAASVRLNAQDIGVDYIYPPRIQWSDYDPYYSITNRVYAQAELIRAQGDAAIGFAQSRNLNAEAYSQELDNWEKELRVYWERKILSEKKKLERDHIRQIKRMKFLNDKKWQNNRTWDRLKNHSELNDGRIRSGAAQNFLLARLAGSALPYQYDSASSRYGDDALDELNIDKQWLGHIRLKQGAFVFGADKSVQEQISVWPYVLRWDEFESARSAYEQARAVVVRESETDKQVAVETIQRLERTLMMLTNEFHRSAKVNEWMKHHRRYSQFHTSDHFLRDLDRELTGLKKTGDIRPFQGGAGYDPEIDGDHVISLLSFMNRNGLEFARPEPGGEFAYHNLFVLMRALYLTVAEDDESLQPKNLADEVDN